MILVNQKPLKRDLVFPGGEVHIALDLEEIMPVNEVYAFLRNANDIMKLMLTVDAIYQAVPGVVVNLTIPYVPYARQDRIAEAGESLSIGVMANLINSMGFKRVTIYDPHSDVTPALINNLEVVSLEQIVSRSELVTLVSEKEMTIVSPDAGAVKKVQKLAQKLNTTNLVIGSKVRDSLTGEITGTKIEGDVEGKDVIIFDDICDGGRTFIELSKVLKKMSANEIYLYVTHGIFSKGLEVLKPYFTHIFSSFSFLKKAAEDENFLTILKRGEL